MLVLVGQLTYLQVVDADNLENDPRNVRARAARHQPPARRHRHRRRRGRWPARSRRPTAPTSSTSASTRSGALFSQIVGLPVVRRRQHRRREDLQRRARRPRRRPAAPEPARRRRGASTTTGTVVLSIRADAAARAPQDALGDQRGSVVAARRARPAGSSRCTRTRRYDPQPLAGHDTKVVQAYFAAAHRRTRTSRTCRARTASCYPPGSTFKIGHDRRSRSTTASRRPTTGLPDRCSELAAPADEHHAEELRRRARAAARSSRASSMSCNTTFGQIGLDLGDPFVPGHGAVRRRRRCAAARRRRPARCASIGPAGGHASTTDSRCSRSPAIGQGDVATTPAADGARRRGGRQRRRDHRAPRRSARSATRATRLVRTHRRQAVAHRDDARRRRRRSTSMMVHGRRSAAPAPGPRSPASRSPARPGPRRPTRGAPARVVHRLRAGRGAAVRGRGDRRARRQRSASEATGGAVAGADRRQPCSQAALAP